MKTGIRLGAFAFFFMGFGVLWVEAVDPVGTPSVPINCPNNKACQAVMDPSYRKNKGIYGRCLPGFNGGTVKGCAVYFLADTTEGDPMKMATTPSCDNCIVRNSIVAMTSCNQFKDANPNFKMNNNKYCITSATPYLCTNPNGNEEYYTCSIQAMRCT